MEDEFNYKLLDRIAKFEKSWFCELGRRENVYLGKLLKVLTKVIQQNPRTPVTPNTIRQVLIEVLPEEFRVIECKATWRSLMRVADNLARGAEKQFDCNCARRMRDGSEAIFELCFLVRKGRCSKPVQLKKDEGEWYWCPLCWRPVRGGYLQRPEQCDLHKSNSKQYQAIMRLAKSYYDNLLRKSDLENLANESREGATLTQTLSRQGDNPPGSLLDIAGVEMAFSNQSQSTIECIRNTWRSLHDYLPVEFLHEARKATENMRKFSWETMLNVKDYNYLPIEFRNIARKAKKRLLLTYAWDAKEYNGYLDDNAFKSAWAEMLARVNRDDYKDCELAYDDVTINISHLPRIEAYLKVKNIQIGQYPKITEVLEQLAQSGVNSERVTLPEMDFREMVAMLTRAEAWLSFMATKPGRGGKRKGAGRPKKE